MDRQMLAWFHRWVGRICVLHSLLHCSLLVTVARTMNLADSRYIIPIAVSKVYSKAKCAYCADQHLIKYRQVVLSFS
jgi:hypothetical protein